MLIERPNEAGGYICRSSTCSVQQTGRVRVSFTVRWHGWQLGVLEKKRPKGFWSYLPSFPAPAPHPLPSAPPIPPNFSFSSPCIFRRSCSLLPLLNVHTHAFCAFLAFWLFCMLVSVSNLTHRIYRFCRFACWRSLACWLTFARGLTFAHWRTFARWLSFACWLTLRSSERLPAKRQLRPPKPHLRPLAPAPLTANAVYLCTGEEPSGHGCACVVIWRHGAARGVSPL